MTRRRERASRLRDYFDLQLRFAAEVARRLGIDPGDAVTRFTNLHRRFGQGMIGQAPESAFWRAYLAGLDPADHEARLAWTQDCFLRAPDEQPPPGQHRFGCFACDEPGPDGEVRIHFANMDGDGTSPLHPARADRRRRELAALFGWVHERFSGAGRVRGTSWLYHLEAYRRLFPPDYTASRRAPERPLQFHGSSSWGQFLDHREQVRPGPRAAFLESLPRLDPADLRRAFPLPVLQVTAPLSSFLAHYGDLAARSAGAPPSGPAGSR